MFFRHAHMQYNAKPNRPDPLYARQLQEVLGGQWGEISVMMSYLFQGWNCRAPQKYRDMLLDIGTEEIAHVEMLATMIAQLLEGAPVVAQEEAVQDPAVLAVMGGVNPQHYIVAGLGAQVAGSVGVPGDGRYVTASGNLMCDFRYNLTAESMGRLQVCRLYEQTTDAGVRDMLSFLIARDTMHQNQWIAALAELEADGFEETPAPNSFPQGLELEKVAYQFWNCSTGTESREGQWASGAAPDGKGEFEYVENPRPMGPEPDLGVVDPRTWGTPLTPVKVSQRKAS